MHTPVKVTIEKLNRKLQGHFNYYGIIGNYEAMHGFREYVLERLRATWNRRGADKDMTVEEFWRLLKVYPVAMPKIVHRV